MTNPNHSPAKTSLHEQIEQINGLLASLRPRLVEAEAELSERLAAISAFEFKLVDYKVRILDGENATAATTRVLIDTRQGKKSWSTVGASANIIVASWQALADSMEYALLDN